MLHASTYHRARAAGFAAAVEAIGKEADRLARAARIASNRAHAGKLN